MTTIMAKTSVATKLAITAVNWRQIISKFSTFIFILFKCRQPAKDKMHRGKISVSKLSNLYLLVLTSFQVVLQDL